MADKWPVKTIAECASDQPYSTQIGPFGKALTPAEYTDSGVPLLRGVNVNHGRFHDDGFVFISEETAERLAKFESFPGDVLLVHKGTLGKIGLMPKNRRFSRYIMGNSMLRVRCNPQVLLPDYLYYWLSSSEGTDYLLSRVSQVGVPQIQQPLTTLRQARLPVPPPEEQKRIVGILSALDDKIELNRRLNRTLEQMAAALFKSWFVDFDPVRAKAAGQQPPGLSPEIAALFPDAFQHSELGEIPKGWEPRSVGQLCEFAYGKALKADERRPGPIPVMGSNGQIGTHIESLVKGPGVIVGRKGNPGIVTWVTADFFPIDTTFYVVPLDKECPLTYLSFALESLNLANLGADSAVPGLNRNIAYSSKVPRPHTAVMQRFDDLLLAIRCRQDESDRESRTLAALRDALLPKLISGQYIPDPEQVVGRAS